MRITFAPKGILQIDDCMITFKNFSGIAGPYNREGDRSFAIIIPDQETADILVEEGWNVKIKPPREENAKPFIYLTVKVKYNDRGPHAYLKSGNRLNALDEESIGVLDNVDILSADLDIRPYDWEINGKTGRTAYLQSIKAIQKIFDRFADEYNAQE